MKVRCVRKLNIDDDITIGKVYEVINIDGEMLRILDDEGDVSYCAQTDDEPNGYVYIPELFEIVEDKDNKLKELFDNIEEFQDNR